MSLVINSFALSLEIKDILENWLKIFKICERKMTPDFPIGNMITAILFFESNFISPLFEYNQYFNHHTYSI